MASPQVTVTGNFVDLTGVAINGYCAFSIFSPTGATEFKVAGTGQVVPNRVQTGLGTSFSQLIYGNDVIADIAGNTNTLWNVSCYNAANQSFWDFLYSFAGANSFNLVSTAPTNPPPSLPAPLNAQAANTVYAGPAGGGPATPTFRSLTTADIPSIAKADILSQSANINSTLLYAVPASGAGMYIASCYVVLTQAANISSTLPSCIIQFTDNDTGVPSLITYTSTNTNNAVGTVGLLFNPAAPPINAKASTNINFSTINYASNGPGAMQYAVHIKLAYLGS